MAEPTAPQAVRLAELLAVLALGTDLGLGQPMEHVLRQCLIALRLAEPAGLDGQDREALYYGSLLAWVGCHVDAYEQAKWFGDDMALKRDYRLTDFASPTAGPLYLLRHVGAGRPVHERLQVGAGFLHEGMQAAGAMLDNHWRGAVPVRRPRRGGELGRGHRRGAGPPGGPRRRGPGHRARGDRRLRRRQVPVHDRPLARRGRPRSRGRPRLGAGRSRRD